jgi:serine/threonine protein phosphatase PrpC
MTLPKTEPLLPGTETLDLPRPLFPFTVRSYGLTDPGRVRPSNEDQFAIVELARTLSVHGTSLPQSKAQYSSHRGYIFVVADGMGGHQAGEVASAMTVLTIEGFLLNTLQRFFNLTPTDEQTVLKEFQSALLEADTKIFEEAARHPEMLGMGTTLTMALAIDWRLFIAHAGDSRCYLYSQNQLHQLTQDHTMVAEMVRIGGMSAKDAAHHRLRHAVTNAVGGNEPGVHGEVHKLDLEPGDLLLVCSDGLTEMLADEHIAAVIASDPDPKSICERLVADANQHGGKDNITVVVGVFPAP